MNLLSAYLKRQWKLLLLLSCFAAVLTGVFYLYQMPAEPLLYGGALCLVLGAALFSLSYVRFCRRHRELQWLLLRAREQSLPLPPPRGLLEEDYQSLLEAVCVHRAALASENDSRLQDMTDYYTLWAHQIKTPIAAMGLLLQEESRPELEAELLKIRQYVDMVLNYLRLGSSSTDYVLRPCPLDPLLRQAARKYARMFILKKNLPGLPGNGKDRADGRKVAGLRGGTAAVQRPEIHAGGRCHPGLRRRGHPGDCRQRHRHPGGGHPPCL